MADPQKPRITHQREHNRALHHSYTQSRQDAETQTEVSCPTAGHITLSCVQPMKNHKCGDLPDNGCYRAESLQGVISDGGKTVNANYSRKLISGVRTSSTDTTKYQETASEAQSLPHQLQEKRHHMDEKNPNCVTEKILKLALKIICLLSGEPRLRRRRTLLCPVEGRLSTAVRRHRASDLSGACALQYYPLPSTGQSKVRLRQPWLKIRRGRHGKKMGGAAADRRCPSDLTSSRTAPRSKEQKILDLTNKITELLTEESANKNNIKVEVTEREETHLVDEKDTPIDPFTIDYA
ncbi:unnamed protein product [Ranitomeya imitator]|uniref:Uncharacterized protein n=1 Tax=Ranitomeya imitator TaxID=111125 RepID=A0ABN9L9A8_9NEOB|nr:unnamed protein product [Ranitomeya imitator]